MQCHRMTPQSLAARALILAFTRSDKGYTLAGVVDYETGQALPLTTLRQNAMRDMMVSRIVRFIDHDVPLSAALSEVQAREWATGMGFLARTTLLYRDAPAINAPYAIAVLASFDEQSVAPRPCGTVYRKFVGDAPPVPDESSFDAIVWCDDHLADGKASHVEDNDGQWVYGPAQRALRQAVTTFPGLVRFSADFHVPDRDALSKGAAFRCDTEPSGYTELDLLRVVLQPSKLPQQAGYSLLSAFVRQLDETHYRLFVDALVEDPQRLKAEALAERLRVTGTEEPIRSATPRQPQSVEQQLYDVLIACNEDPDFAKFGAYQSARRFGSADALSRHARGRFSTLLRENGGALGALMTLAGVLLRADMQGAIRKAIHNEGMDDSYGSAVFHALKELGEDGLRELAHTYELDLEFVRSQMQDV